MKALGPIPPGYEANAEGRLQIGGWEAEVLVYPTVLKIDGTYLMWYGSYDNAIRRETTAIGFAASTACALFLASR